MAQQAGYEQQFTCPALLVFPNESFVFLMVGRRSGPDTGQSPVECGDFLLGWPGSLAWLTEHQVWLTKPQSWLAELLSWLAEPQAWLASPIPK